MRCRPTPNGRVCNKGCMNVPRVAFLEFSTALHDFEHSLKIRLLVALLQHPNVLPASRRCHVHIWQVLADGDPSRVDASLPGPRHPGVAQNSPPRRRTLTAPNLSGAISRGASGVDPHGTRAHVHPTRGGGAQGVRGFTSLVAGV